MKHSGPEAIRDAGLCKLVPEEQCETKWWPHGGPHQGRSHWPQARDDELEDGGEYQSYRYGSMARRGREESMTTTRVTSRVFSTLSRRRIGPTMTRIRAARMMHYYGMQRHRSFYNHDEKGGPETDTSEWRKRALLRESSRDLNP